MGASYPNTLTGQSELSPPEVREQIARWGPSATRKLDALRPNLIVRCAFYLSLAAIPFFLVYLPGTGEHLGVMRVIQGLLLLAMLSRPKVCLRLLPVALLWFLAYCGVRILAGICLAPEYARIWWPSTLDLLQFCIPWAWFLFNLMRYPSFSYNGMWAFVAGASICGVLHILGIGTVDVDHGIEGRSGIFDMNANEIGAIYGLAFVAIVALGLFRQTRPGLRLVVFPVAAVLAVAIAKTGSRGAALLAALGILVLLPQTRAYVPRIKRYLVFLMVALVFAGVMYQIPTVMKRLAPVASSNATREEARGRMIPVLWEMFLRSPIYGSGPDQYQYELTRRAMPYLTEKQETIRSHNLALLLLVETGVIGFALFAAGLGKALLSAWRAREGPNGLLPLAWLLPSTIAGLTIASPIFSPIFWVAIAYALAGRGSDCAPVVNTQPGR